MGTNYYHRYPKRNHDNGVGDWYANPHDDIHVGDPFNGSSPNAFAAGVVTTVHDSKVYRIFTMTDPDGDTITARIRHDGADGWVVQKRLVGVGQEDS